MKFYAVAAGKLGKLRFFRDCHGVTVKFGGIISDLSDATIRDLFRETLRGEDTYEMSILVGGSNQTAERGGTW